MLLIFIRCSYSFNRKAKKTPFYSKKDKLIFNAKSRTSWERLGGKLETSEEIRLYVAGIAACFLLRNSSISVGNSIFKRSKNLEARVLPAADLPTVGRQVGRY